MHRRALMVTALTAGVWVAACSRPTSQNDQNLATSSKASARQIELVEAPGGAEALASDLEARRAPRPAHSRAVNRLTATVGAGEPDARPTHDHAIAAAAAVTPEVGRTSSSMADTPLALATAPLPAPVSATPTLLVGHGFEAGGSGSGGPSAGIDPDPQPGPISRNPTIIIRGGMGSPHDDCKIHGQGGGPGLAINRIAPAFAGGEVRGNTGGRFPRGGIR